MADEIGTRGEVCTAFALRSTAAAKSKRHRALVGRRDCGIDSRALGRYAAQSPFRSRRAAASCCAAILPFSHAEEGVGEEDVEAGDLHLDAEAQAMLDELDSSQAEVQNMLAEQRVQADELGGLRDNLANEVYK
jgi:hypothetical protein